jgi:hypothetical protein
VRGVLDAIPGGNKAKVGIITFANHVHFYDVKGTMLRNL